MTDEIYTDSTPMPFGKHDGTKLANAPASYLLWLHRSGCSDPKLRAYIVDNLEDLEGEVEEDKNNSKPRRD